MEPRVKLEDLARRTGLSRMTVSRALRNLPGVGPEARAKIQALAKELGFSLDARTSEIMGAFRHAREPQYKESVAFVFTHQNHFAEEELAGALAAAEVLKYRIDVIKPWESGMRGPNVSRVLKARGIRGVLLSPNAQSSHPHYTLDWNTFAAVLLGSSLANKQLPRVRADHFGNVQMIIRKLTHLGYSRIGLLVDRLLDERTNRALSGAFRAWSAEPSHDSRIFYIERSSHPGQLTPWIRKEKLDAILADIGHRYDQWLRPAGFHCPVNIGFAALSVTGTPGVSGAMQNLRKVGYEALFTLDALLRSQRFGLQKDASTLLIPAVWQPGTTAVAKRN